MGSEVPTFKVQNEVVPTHAYGLIEKTTSICQLKPIFKLQ